MTRVTNFGIKRTYLEAGFSNDQAPSNETALIVPGGEKSSTGKHDPSEAAPPKKKRKRTPKSKRDGNLTKNAAESKGDEGKNVKGDTDDATTVENGTTVPATQAGKSAKRNKRNKERRNKIISDSEARRRKRISQKLVETTCFACREKGHAAKDCPTAQKSTEGDDDGEEKATNVVGICYRCGSKRHTLSRCKKPSNPADPYPYASCFVCKGKGHLASTCPQNKSKGVYPNGGSCKLCGDTSHLAKDCGIRQKVVDPTVVLGTGLEAGPDEDDFHTFKRRTAEVDRDEKQASKMKQMLELRAGVHSGVVKAFGNVPAMAKKVVVFK